MSVARFVAGLAAVAPLASALTIVGGSDPTAGAIYLPDATHGVTAGEAYTITYEPKTSVCGDTIDIVLLTGPTADDMVAISYIAQGVNNTGTYSWTPSTDLAPSDSDYAVENVCVSTSAYQYSTRFGLTNADYVSNSTNSTSTAASSAATTVKYPTGNSTSSGASSGTTHKTKSKTTTTTAASSSASVTTETATATDAAATTSSTTSSASSSSSSAAAATARKSSFGGLFAAAAAVAYVL